MADSTTDRRKLRRLKKELLDIHLYAEEPDSQINANMLDGNISHWKGHIKGPKGTPYEDGHFILDVIIPPEYPYVAPKIQFETKIWHPNISSQTGMICLDILKNEWSPALTIRTALLSIQALLSSPEPDDPQDSMVAQMYKNNYPTFVQTAKMWVNFYARDNQTESEDAKLKKLTEMGFSASQAWEALKHSSWNESIALDRLLGS